MSSYPLGDPEKLILGAAKAVRKRAIQERVADPSIDEVELRNKLCDVFPEFMEEHPILFIKCCDTTFHLDKMEWMLSQISEAKRGVETKEGTIREVVGGLQNEFLAPAVEAAERKRLKKD